MKLTLALGLAALAVGCATSTSDDAASSASEVEVSGTAPAPVVDPDYLVFNVRAEADAWYAGIAPAIGLSGTPAPETDPRAQRIAGIIGRHWPTIQAKYGVTMRAPFPMVLDSTQSNAFAMFDPRAKKIPNVIFILSGILAQTDDDLSAVLAHEMGHMITKNGIPAYNRALTKFYDAGPTETLGIVANDDAAVRGFIEPYLKDVSFVGPYPQAQLHGIPLGNGVLSRFFANYAKQHQDPSDPGCADVNTHLDNMQRALVAGQGATVDTEALAAQQSSIACMKPPADVDFGAAFQALFNVPVDALHFSTTRESSFAGVDALSGLFATTESLRGEMRAVVTAPAFVTTRQYTNEEQADDFAMTVLHAEGTDPESMGKSLLKLGSQASIDKCNAQLAAGVVPTYGITDPHHSNCYRAFHARAFSAYLNAGGAGVLPVTAPVVFDRESFDPLQDRVLID